MKAKMVLFLTLFALVAVAAGCAATSPQVRPATPDSFVGTWEGSWQSSVGKGSGGVNLTISLRPDDGSFDLVVNLTNSRFANWGTEARFKDGTLVVDRPRLQMELRLYENGRFEATYDVSGGDRGYWSLTRKKK